MKLLVTHLITWVVLSVVLTDCARSHPESPEESQAQSTGFNRVTCEARNLFTKNVQIRTAGNVTDACQSALRECWDKGGTDGRACTILRWYDSVTTAEGMMSDRGRVCQVGENIGPSLRGRTWVRPGHNEQEAESNALRYCQKNKAGDECQIIRCYDADNASPY